MKKSKSAFLFAFFTFVLLISVSAISAADTDNDTIIYDTVASDTTQNAIETADNSLPDVKTSDNNNLKSINPNSGNLGADYEIEVDILEAYDYSIEEYVVLTSPLTIGYENDILLAQGLYDVWSEEEYGVEGLELTLTDNGVYVGSNLTHNDQWYYTITSPAIGEHNFVVSFAGNEHFEPFESTGTVIVSENSHSDVIIEDIDFYDPSDDYEVELGDSLTLVGTVYDNEYDTVEDVEVLIYEDDVQIGTSTTDSYGDYEFEYEPTTAGNHILYAICSSIQSTPRTISVKSSLESIDLEVDALCAWDEDIGDYVPITNGMIIALGNDIKLKQSVTDLEGGDVSGLTFIASIDGVDYTNTTDSNGNWYYIISSPEEGEYEIEVSFDGNVNYNYFFTDGTITVQDQSIDYEVTDLEFYDPFDEYEVPLGETLTFAGTAYDFEHDDTPVPNAEISIYEDDVQIGTSTTDDNGDYEFVYEPSSVGTHVLYAMNGTVKSMERTVTVNKAESFIRLDESMIDENEIDVGQNFTISGTLLSNNVAIPYADIIIKVTDDDNTEHVITNTVQTDANGKFSYNYMPLPYGVKQLNVTFEGNNDYTPYSTGEDGYTFEVINPGVEIESLTVTEAKWEDNVNWSALVTYTNGTPFPTGRLSFNLKNDTEFLLITSSNIVDGEAYNNTTIPFSFRGEYELVIVCYDTPVDDEVNNPYSKILANVTVGTFTVISQSLISVTTEGDNLTTVTTIVANVTDVATTESVVGGTVTITDKENPEITSTLENTGGSLTFILNGLPAGEHTFELEYSGNTEYEGTTIEITVLVNKAKTNVIANVNNNVYNNTTLDVSVVDMDNTPITEGKISIDDVEYNITGEITTIPIFVDITGANVNVTYKGNNTYDESSYELEVIPVKRDVSIDADTTIVVDSPVLFVEVADLVTGEYNATGSVTVTVDGTDYVGTIEDGFADVDLSGLAVGSYSAGVVYSGDDYYNNKTIIGLNIEIVLRDTMTIVEVLNNTYGNVSLNVTVKAVDQQETRVTSGILTVNGKTYNITGESTIIDLDLKVGEHEVTVDYAGSEIYAESNKTITINVVPLTTTTVVEEVVAYSGDNITLKAIITDDLGNLVNSGKVAFKINGKTIGTATVSNGVATLNTTASKSWVKKDVTVFAKYAGGSNYVSSNDTATVTVTLKTATVDMITTGVYQPGANITLIAMVSSDSKVVNSGYVFFKLNGITLTDAEGNVIKANVINGLAQATYTLSSSIAASDHTITAVFIEENYNRAEDNETFTIAKAIVILEVNDISILEGQPAVLTGKLVDKFGNLVTRSTKITVKINGISFIAAQTVSDGIINFTLNQSTNGKTSIDDFKLNKIYDIVVYAGENSRNLGTNATAVLVKK